jgi:hypothetical protein
MILGIIIILYLIVITTDFRIIVKGNNKKTIILYSIILLITFITMTLDSFNIKIPSPSIIIQNVITSIMKG